MIERVSDLGDARLADFAQLTDVQLRKSFEGEHGLYLAESTKVIERSIAAGHVPRAFLLLEEWLPTLEPVMKRFPEVPAYVGDGAQLQALTGFHMHRGAIASMKRPTPEDPERLLETSRTVVVLDGLADHTNVGAIFRSVAALGADAVLLSPDCADPLYRRAVRVSMGAVLQVPWARLPDWREAGPMIRNAGFALVRLDLDDEAEDLETFVQDIPPRRALIFGSEGTGISRKARGASTRCVTIPMEHGVDSLNVATSAAIVLWAIRAADSRGGGDEA